MVKIDQNLMYRISHGLGPSYSPRMLLLAHERRGSQIFPSRT